MIDFLGIGAQKAGTTWLYEWLSRHPAITFPAGKEVHYWDQPQGRPAQWWLELFPTVEGVRQGEITPAYSFLHRETVEALRLCTSDSLRIFFSLRNPKERAWSSALMALGRAEMTIDEASDAWFIDHFLSAGSLKRGDYESCLKTWRAVFPTERIKLLDFDRIAVEPRAVLAELAEFLEVDPAFWNALPDGQLRAEVFRGLGVPIRPSLGPVLQEIYEPRIESLEQYLGWDLAKWKGDPCIEHAPREVRVESTNHAAEGLPPRTNVLMIVADDLNAWLGCLGVHPGASTPNIDRLAEQGALFTHAYCTAPYCSASRMSVFTGLRPSTSGIYHNERLNTLQDSVEVLFSQFRDNGYYLFGAGKVFHGEFGYRHTVTPGAASAPWDDSHNVANCWNEYYPNLAEPMPDGRPRNGFFDFSVPDSVPGWYHLFDWGPIPDEQAAELPDERVVQAFERFIADPPAQPFFGAVGLYKPHLPWYVPQRFFDLHPLESIVLPMVKEDDLNDVPEIAQRWALEPPDHELIVRHGQWKHAVQGYLASVSYCDYLVGRVMAALEASGQADHTVVLLWGDNGFHLGEKLHWRKFTLWEEATRVPLIFRAPHIQASPVRWDGPVSLLDIYPTLCALCDLPVPAQLEGISLEPWIRDASQSATRPPIATWGRGNHSVRTQRWRYTRYLDGSEELYDHETDPYEWTNLADRAEFRDVKRRLSVSIRGLEDWPKYGGARTEGT